MFKNLATLWRRRAPRRSTPRAQHGHFVPTLERLEDRLAPAISFAVVNDWGSGFQGQITITDPLTTPINNWSLAFDFNHSITNLWNGTIASQTGTNRALFHAVILPPGSRDRVRKYIAAFEAHNR